MRGGTSKGPFFLKSDLPAGDGTRDAVLLAAMDVAEGPDGNPRVTARALMTGEILVPGNVWDGKGETQREPVLTASKN